MTGANIRVLFHQPCIPPNTGNAIRMVAGAGCELHLAGPLGFTMTDTQVKRAGLDYHEMADVVVHENIERAFEALLPARVFAFTAKANKFYTDVVFRPGDVLMFGPEPTGLEQAVLDDDRVSEHLRLPMLPGRRSMNLANAAAVAVYEAWRQTGFPGGV